MHEIMVIHKFWPFKYPTCKKCIVIAWNFDIPKNDSQKQNTSLAVLRIFIISLKWNLGLAHGWGQLFIPHYITDCRKLERPSFYVLSAEIHQTRHAPDKYYNNNIMTSIWTKYFFTFLSPYNSLLGLDYLADIQGPRTAQVNPQFSQG